MEVENVSNLNERARDHLEPLLERSAALRLRITEPVQGALLVDAGVEAPGGLEAGLEVARIVTAGLADVTLAPSEQLGSACPEVVVRTDHPVAACMASQYAGWQVNVGKFFAMGSGAMRAAYGKEDLFDELPSFRDGSAEHAVGVLESGALPGADVFEYIADKTRVALERVALVVARTGSIAGGVQVVARSVETALHKLHALGFDLRRIQAGFGSAPLPPPTGNDLVALGRTNDAVLYGARVILWVDADDDTIRSVGENVPSASSDQHGAPFLEVFERFDRDFYKIDPGLFSPAQVTLQSLVTGRSQTFGQLEPAILEQSFFG